MAGPYQTVRTRRLSWKARGPAGAPCTMRAPFYSFHFLEQQSLKQASLSRGPGWPVAASLHGRSLWKLLPSHQDRVWDLSSPPGLPSVWSWQPPGRRSLSTMSCHPQVSNKVSQQSLKPDGFTGDSYETYKEEWMPDLLQLSLKVKRRELLTHSVRPAQPWHSGQAPLFLSHRPEGLFQFFILLWLVAFNFWFLGRTFNSPTYLMKMPSLCEFPWWLVVAGFADVRIMSVDEHFPSW